MGHQRGLFQYFVDLFGPPTSHVSEGCAKTLIKNPFFPIFIFSHLFTKISWYLLQIRWKPAFLCHFIKIMGKNPDFHPWGPQKYLNIFLTQLWPQIVEKWDDEVVDFIFSYWETYFCETFPFYSLLNESKTSEIWNFKCSWSGHEGAAEPPSGGMDPTTTQWMPIATVAMATQTWCK